MGTAASGHRLRIGTESAFTINKNVLERVLQDQNVSPFSRHSQVPCKAWKACSPYERGVKRQTQIGKVSTAVVALA